MIWHNAGNNVKKSMMRTLFVTIACIYSLFFMKACYSPTLPLPPPSRVGLTVSAPDDEGIVEITGRPGVVEPGQQAVILNLRTLYGWIVPAEESGFTAYVEADFDDILSIRRQAGQEQSPAIEIVVPGPAD